MTRSLFSEQYDRLCQLLIRTRVQAGLSQAQLAKCLQRPQSFVSKYETKQRRLDVVEFLEIAHCMKVNGAELLHHLASGPPLTSGAAPMAFPDGSRSGLSGTSPILSSFNTARPDSTDHRSSKPG
jgi:hypothetical protein